MLSFCTSLVLCFLFVISTFTYFCNSVLLHFVLPLYFPCTSLVLPLYFPCTSSVLPLYFLLFIAFHSHLSSLHHLHYILTSCTYTLYFSPCLFRFFFILRKSTLLFTSPPVKAMPSGRNTLEKLNVEYSVLIILLSARIQIRYFSHINFFTSIFAVLGSKAASPNYYNRFPFTN